MKYIDKFLNGITMYRLLLYFLIALLLVASVYSAIGLLPFNYVSFIVSILFLLSVSLLSNALFAHVFEAHTNVESVYISSLILSLIIAPAKDIHGLIFLGWAGVLTTASKYILNIKKKHIFNPVAIAVALTAFVLGDSAIWWVGNAYLLPFVLAGGILIVRKIQREDLFFSFLVTATAVTLLHNPALFLRLFTDTPLLFFATVMLTEPLTTPPTKHFRIIYGIIIGLLFAPQIRFMTPELALLIGNIYSYFVSPKEKLLLRLKEKIELAPHIFDFVFEDHTDFAFIPGQYMEWTLGHSKPDDRGNRRYFTLASSPTEKSIRVGVRFSDASSTFKKTLLGMTPGSTIVAGQRSGDFVLPEDPGQKLVFIAGGIGITPFRSIIKYITDTNERRDIVLFYCVRSESEIVYKDVFEAAEKLTGMKTVYIITQRDGRLDRNKMAAFVPDWNKRMFYLSGPNSLVNGFSATLRDLGVHESRIKTDFFPGFM
jgi:ferredoxin-NADP reductase